MWDHAAGAALGQLTVRTTQRRFAIKLKPHLRGDVRVQRLREAGVQDAPGNVLDESRRSGQGLVDFRCEAGLDTFLSQLSQGRRVSRSALQQKPRSSELPKCSLLIRPEVPEWQTPDDAVFVDAIPLGATGKILKTRVRQMMADYRLPGSMTG